MGAVLGRALLAAVVAAAWLAAPAAGAEPQSITDFLPVCTTYGPDDQEVCSGQVPSFDGMKLDVDVTRPFNDQGVKRHPLIVMLNGFSNTKHEWESVNDEADGADKWHWNSHWFAKHGYYVLTYTPRGFCHRAPDTATACEPPEDHAAWTPNTPEFSSAQLPSGTIHLKSRDFEIRDTQWLAALVAAGFPDVDPGEVAVTGGSYGGGESWMQASQANWTFPSECTDPDSFSPPTGCPPPSGVDFGRLPVLKLQAAIPKYPWSDLGYSLAPNGHPRPADCPTPNAPPDDDPYYESSQGCWNSDTGDGNPVGVEKLSYVNAFYALGNGRGVFEAGTTTTPSEEGPIDIHAWNDRFTVQGDPYDVAGVEDAIVRQVRRGLTEFRGAYYQDQNWDQQKNGRKVAIFSIQGWTDDLFPAVESFRMFKYLKRLDPRWPVEVALADVGHMRAQNKPETWHRLNVQAFQFLQSNIVDTDRPHDQQTIVSSQPTICPGEPNQTAAQSLTATTPEGLANGRLSVEYSRSGSITNPAGVFDPKGPRTDPVLGEGGCQEEPSEPPFPGIVKYSAVSEPLDRTQTYIGLGTLALPGTVITADTATIDVRVWDQPPGGEERLMTRGTYRYDAPAYDPVAGTPPGTPLKVPLFGNHFMLAPGDRIRLEVSQVDFPFLRPSTVPSEVTFGPPTLTLPTRQAGERTLPGE